MSENKQGWMELSSIQLGGVICLPVILIGHEIAKTAGLGAACMALVLGNALLFGLSIITSLMSVQSRMTTAENAEHYFGKAGKCFFAVIIALSLSCWFAIQTQVMSHDVAALIHAHFSIKIPEMMLNGCFAALMIGCAFFGLQGVTFLANCTLPLMIATLGLALVVQSAKSEQSIVQEISYGFSAGGLSLVIAA
ncbi:MAG TPA: hypothetical protein VN457_04195, partial [Chlamydiales bacterium]|nr:hypothetical protein [Chlamydiales bacterium]